MTWRAVAVSGRREPYLELDVQFRQARYDVVRAQNGERVLWRHRHRPLSTPRCCRVAVAAGIEAAVLAGTLCNTCSPLLSLSVHYVLLARCVAVGVACLLGVNGVRRFCPLPRIS